MSMPPNTEVPVSLSGNAADATTDRDFKGSPCGVVNEDPYQAKVTPGSPALPRPGAVPISAYCQEPALNKMKTFVEQVYRFPSTPRELLQPNISFDITASTIQVQQNPTPSPTPIPETQHYHYNLNRRLFFQTVLKYATTVDFVCQCRQGIIPALLVWSNALNIRYKFSQSEQDLANSQFPWHQNVALLLQQLGSTIYFSGMNPGSPSDFSNLENPAENVLGCPIVTLTRFAYHLSKNESMATIANNPQTVTMNDVNPLSVDPNVADVWDTEKHSLTANADYYRRFLFNLFVNINHTNVGPVKDALSTPTTVLKDDCTIYDFNASYQPFVPTTPAPTPAPTLSPTQGCTERIPKLNVITYETYGTGISLTLGTPYFLNELYPPYNNPGDTRSFYNQHDNRFEDIPGLKFNVYNSTTDYDRITPQLGLLSPFFGCGPPPGLDTCIAAFTWVAKSVYRLHCVSLKHYRPPTTQPPQNTPVDPCVDDC